MGPLPPLPPLNLDFGSASKSALDQTGASWAGFGAGDWNVNVAGSGLALQSASSMNYWLIAAAAAAAYLIFKK